jgi:PIN domain nuclease of toxin-antitoxin system
MDGRRSFVRKAESAAAHPSNRRRIFPPSASLHRDPADQIIVATARIHNISLLTAESRILAYPHVRLA